MDDKTKLSAKEKEIVDRDIERWSLYPGDRTAVYAACEAVLASRCGDTGPAIANGEGNVVVSGCEEQ